jgi:Zn-dependent metalloprotease
MMRTRSLATVLALAMLLVGAVASPSRASDDGLRLIAVKHSLLGAHEWYAQTYRGLPVLDGYLARHLDTAGRVVRVVDGRVPIRGAVAATAAVSSAQAEQAVGVGTPREASLAVLGGDVARLVWVVLADTLDGTRRTLVDASSGAVIGTGSAVRTIDGTGQVFDPNPVVTLRDQDLTDDGNRDRGAFVPAYRQVTLPLLDGSGYLRGDFAYVTVSRHHNPLAYSPHLKFGWDRSDPRFEQTMAYYDVTAAQQYIQSLGFLDVNNEAQLVMPDEFLHDNSYYDGTVDRIVLGKGGVDDAEDADVTWHELGHAIQDDQVPGFGARHDAGSIGEAFGDYWAVTMSQPVNGGYQVPCVADWDSTSYTDTEPHCLRRVDLDLTVADETGEIHHDGQIWSRALWDINQGLGRDEANSIILEAQFGFAPDTRFAEAALTTCDTAKALYGNSAQAVCLQAFEDRGIL